MALMGRTSVAGLDRSALLRPSLPPRAAVPVRDDVAIGAEP
jgi:hypothetical protein